MMTMIMVIILSSVFIMLSSWHSHCENYPGHVVSLELQLAVVYRKASGDVHLCHAALYRTAHKQGACIICCVYAFRLKLG